MIGESGGSHGVEAEADRRAGESEPDYRFTLANERTFLSWQRAALGLLAAALAVLQFAPATGVPALREVLGVWFAALSLLTALAGVRRWTQVDAAMRLGLPLPRHRTPLVLGFGLAALAVAALALVFLGAHR